MTAIDQLCNLAAHFEDFLTCKALLGELGEEATFKQYLKDLEDYPEDLLYVASGQNDGDDYVALCNAIWEAKN